MGWLSHPSSSLFSTPLLSPSLPFNSFHKDTFAARAHRPRGITRRSRRHRTVVHTFISVNTRTEERVSIFLNDAQNKWDVDDQFNNFSQTSTYCRSPDLPSSSTSFPTPTAVKCTISSSSGNTVYGDLCDLPFFYNGQRCVEDTVFLATLLSNRTNGML